MFWSVGKLLAVIAEQKMNLPVGEKGEFCLRGIYLPPTLLWLIINSLSIYWLRALCLDNMGLSESRRCRRGKEKIWLWWPTCHSNVPTHMFCISELGDGECPWHDRRAHVDSPHSVSAAPRGLRAPSPSSGLCPRQVPALSQETESGIMSESPGCWDCPAVVVITMTPVRSLFLFLDMSVSASNLRDPALMWILIIPGVFTEYHYMRYYNNIVHGVSLHVL